MAQGASFLLLTETPFLQPPDCIGSNVTVPRAERDVAFRDSPRLAAFFQSRRNGSSLFNEQLHLANVTKPQPDFSNRTTSVASHAPTGPPPTTAAPAATTVSNATFIRPQSIELQLPPAPPIFVLTPNTTNGPNLERGGSFAVIREFDPYELSESTRPRAFPNETVPSLTRPSSNSSESSAPPYAVSVQQLVPQIQAESSNFSLKGLSHKIVALIDFSRVELESQGVMVHDAEDGFEHKSPLNICKG